MSDVLSGLGLEPAPAEEPTAPEPAAPAAPEPTPAPEPAPAVPTAEETIEVPEGAENPDAVRNAIAAERKKARDAYAHAKALEKQLAEREDAAKPLEQRLQEATTRAEDEARKALRFEVGIAHGLTADLARRLQGTTKEEMESDAQSFISSIGAAKQPTATGFSLNGGPQPAPPAAPVDPAKAHAQLLGQLVASSRS